MANQTWIFIKLNLLCFALCLLFAVCEFLQKGLITEMRNIQQICSCHKNPQKEERCSNECSGRLRENK
jgi:hypothetical protein